jgi:methyltransferase-like protein
VIYISIKQIEKGSDTSSEISLMLNNLQENYQSLDTTIYLRELEKNRMKPNKNTINNNNN